MKTPAGFQEQILQYFPEHWISLQESFAHPPVRAARLQKYARPEGPGSTDSHAEPLVPQSFHPLKSPWFCQGPMPEAPESVQRHFRKEVFWHTDAYYLNQGSDLGKTVFQELGGVYLQDASAMAAVSALCPKPQERILDLCAAPGSKATAIGRKLSGSASLYANEIHPQRVNILTQNLERCGIPAVVTNESPAALARAWPAAFDGILVDAPCSGEGMFRKDPAAMEQWSPQGVEMCALRQREILSFALRMVKPGGRLVYSTCTFNPVENEQIVAWVCGNFPVAVEPLPDWPAWEAGRPELANGFPEILNTRRLWPQTHLGEGHFVARFRILDTIRGDEPARRAQSRHSGKANSRTRARAVKVSLDEFLDASLFFRNTHGELEVKGDGLFVSVGHDLPLGGLKVLRNGVCVASIQHGRLVPHHQLVMATHPQIWRNHRILDEEEIVAYLSGQTLASSAHGGWTGLSYKGLPVGWGKSIPGRLNNLYPKGLRRSRLTSI